MSEDAPQNDQPTEASTPAPEAAPTPEPAPEPTPAPAPEAAAPVSEAETVATPVVDAPAPAAAEAPVDPTVAAPVAPMAAAPVAAPPAHQNGFFIPRWVGYVALAIVGILIVGGIGYAIGHESSSSDGRNAGANFPGGMQNGGGMPGGMQNGNGNGNGNNGNQGGNQGGMGNMPGFPGNQGGNGGQSLPNGNGNSNGNSGQGGFLGVAIQDASDGAGATVTSVQSGSPAADAGLKSGDVITEVDGTEITGAATLAQAIRSHDAGDSVTITYTRDGTTATAKVTLGSVSTSQTN